MLSRVPHYLLAKRVWLYLSRAFLSMAVVQTRYCWTAWTWEKRWRPSKGLNQNCYWNSKLVNVVACRFSVLCCSQHKAGPLNVISWGAGNPSHIFGHVASLCVRWKFIIIHKRKHLIKKLKAVCPDLRAPMLSKEAENCTCTIHLWKVWEHNAATKRLLRRDRSCP